MFIPGLHWITLVSFNYPFCDLCIHPFFMCCEFSFTLYPFLKHSLSFLIFFCMHKIRMIMSVNVETKSKSGTKSKSETKRKMNTITQSKKIWKVRRKIRSKKLSKPEIKIKRKWWFIEGIVKESKILSRTEHYLIPNHSRDFKNRLRIPFIVL